MASTDLDALLEMGFDKARAELAMQKKGDCKAVFSAKLPYDINPCDNTLTYRPVTAAVGWLDEVEGMSLDEIKAADAKAETDPKTVPADLKPGEAAKSLVCGECGRKLRSHAQAEFHATKTGHIDFSESTEEVAALTEEEKKAKIEELRRKLAEKRSGASEQDRLDKKKNEEIRRKSTKETQDIKEDLRKKEQLKDAAAKRKDKLDEIAAKERIRAKIAADREERRLRMEKEKAEREGRAPPAASKSNPHPTASSFVASKPASAYTTTRLRLQLPSSNVQKTFSVDTTLFEVAAAVSRDSGLEVGSFTQNFPKKVFDAVDFGASLKELGLVPSASLIVK